MQTKIASLIFCCLFLLPLITLADTGFVRLVGLPFEPVQNPNINVFLGSLYRLAIGIAAAIAVVRLILAGAQYMLSDVVTTKEQAKTNVRTSIVGLLIVLSAVIVLNTINPQLTRLNALDLQQISVTLSTPEATSDIVEDFCAQDDGCVRTQCSVGGSLAGCQQWCDNRGGIYINNSGLTRDECVTSPQNDYTARVGEVLVNGTFGCENVSGDPGIPEYNCSSATTACEAAGGTRAVADTNRVLCFQDTNPESVTTERRIDCQITDADDGTTITNCSDAIQECERNAQVVRSQRENHIICSG